MRSHHRRKRPDPCPWTDHPGHPCPYSVDQLENIPPLRPGLHRRGTTQCRICQRIIEPGHTIFRPVAPSLRSILACYECGTGLMTFFGYYTEAEARAISAFGGGPPRPHAAGAT